MIRHIVVFQFDEQKISSDLLQKMKTELEALVDKIPVLRKMEVGINANPNEKNHLVLTADIDSLEDVEVYAKHPAHLEVVKLIKPVSNQRACVDYHL